MIFDFDLYAQIVEECLRTLEPDAVLLVHAYRSHEIEASRRLAQRVGEIVRETGRPAAFCAYAQAEDDRAIQRQVRLPIFAEIEEAVRGLAASRDRQRWLVRQAGASPHPLTGSPLALSRLMAENPRIVEVDVNPLLVLETGAVAVDARMVLK